MIELLVTGEAVSIPIDCAPPVNRGSVVVGISTARGGPTVHPTLERTLVWERGGTIPPLRLFARDLRALFPRGGRVWLVVRYAQQLVATSEVRLVVG
ncbi:MAG: hypothetical protein ACK5X2_02810 [Gemmatimonadaceae bacterium]|jgi:hypothetical protein